MLQHETEREAHTRSNPVLYSYRRCPYAIRARMALWLCGFTIEVREISFRHKPDHMLELSPKGTVPVFFQDSSSPVVLLDESLDIMIWAHKTSLEAIDSQSDEARTADSRPPFREAPFIITQDDHALINRNDSFFKENLDAYKYPDRNSGSNIKATDAREACIRVLNDYEKRLCSSFNLTGDDLSLGDLALFPFVRQFAAVDQHWFAQQPLPRVHRWLKAFIESRAFEAVMVKVPMWQPGNEPFILSAGPLAERLQNDFYIQSRVPKKSR